MRPGLVPPMASRPMIPKEKHQPRSKIGWFKKAMTQTAHRNSLLDFPFLRIFWWWCLGASRKAELHSRPSDSLSEASSLCDVNGDLSAWQVETIFKNIQSDSWKKHAECLLSSSKFFFWELISNLKACLCWHRSLPPQNLTNSYDQIKFDSWRIWSNLIHGLPWHRWWGWCPNLLSWNHQDQPAVTPSALFRKMNCFLCQFQP